MPNVWATVTDFDEATQRQLANVLETRGRDEQQRAMRRAFLGDVEFPPEARVLEVGCGTGVLTRTLARSENVAAVVGVDVASALLAQARVGPGTGNGTSPCPSVRECPLSGVR